MYEIFKINLFNVIFNKWEEVSFHFVAAHFGLLDDPRLCCSFISWLELKLLFCGCWKRRCSEWELLPQLGIRWGGKSVGLFIYGCLHFLVIYLSIYLFCCYKMYDTSIPSACARLVLWDSDLYGCLVGHAHCLSRCASSSFECLGTKWSLEYTPRGASVPRVDCTHTLHKLANCSSFMFDFFSLRAGN